MHAKFIKAAKSEDLLNPEGDLWAQAEKQTLALTGTPLGLQPTAYIRNSFKQEDIGAVKQVEVRALHNGKHLAFHLSWMDATQNDKIEDNDQFSDAAAIFLPTKDNAPLVTMGAPGFPVNMWYWRADQATGRHVVAAGIGTTRTIDEKQVVCGKKWSNGHWSVVIARALGVASSEPLVQLRPGRSTKFSVAIWEGSKQERAGLKAFHPEYVELTLDPLV